MTARWQHSPEHLPRGTVSCSFPAAPSSPDPCGHPPVMHVHTGLTQAGTVRHVAACFCHTATALHELESVDWHAWGGVCNMPDTRWVHTDLSGPGRCVWVLEDGTDAATVTAAPVTEGAVHAG